MSLDVKLIVGWVNSGGPNGTEAAPAWVEMPERMPSYGTPEFKKLRIKLFIRKSFLAESSYAQAAIIIGHELSHIVLDSIGHPASQRRKGRRPDRDASWIQSSIPPCRNSKDKVRKSHPDETTRVSDRA
jgi:hypothetical protein